MAMSGAQARAVHPNTRIAKVNLTIADAAEWTPQDGADPSPSTETELMQMAGFVCRNLLPQSCCAIWSSCSPTRIMMLR